MIRFFETKLTLSAYGKLPLSKEFLVLEAFKGPASDFRLWLDRGFSRVAEDLDESTFGSKVVFRDARAKEIIVARVWDSHDSGTQRRFPFAFFVSVPVRRIAKVERGLWSTLEPLFRFLESCFVRAQTLANRSMFLETFSGIDVPWECDPVSSRDEFDRRRAELSIRGWAAHLFDESAEERWSELLWRMGQILQRLGPEDEGPALRLPIAEALPAAWQVDAWALLLRTRWARCPAFPTTILSESSTRRQPRLDLVTRDPKPEDAQLVFSSPRAGNRWADLTAASSGRDREGLESFRRRMKPDRPVRDLDSFTWNEP